MRRAGPRKDYGKVAVARIVCLFLCGLITVLGVLVLGAAVNLTTQLEYVALEGEANSYTMTYFLGLGGGGALVLFAAFGGVCFYVTWNRGAGWLGIIVGGLVAVFLLVVGIIAFASRGSTQTAVSKAFKDSLKNDFTDLKKERYKATLFVDLFQTHTECCGFEGPDDFAKASGNESFLTWIGGDKMARFPLGPGAPSPYQIYPFTCCKSLTQLRSGGKDTGKKGLNSEDLECSGKKTQLWGKSCKDELEKTGGALVPLGALGLASGAVVGLQVGLAVFAVLKGPRKVRQGEDSGERRRGGAGGRKKVEIRVNKKPGQEKKGKPTPRGPQKKGPAKHKHR